LQLLAYKSFQQLVSQENISPPSFETNLLAMEAVELMATTCELGDQVLALVQRGQIPTQEAESLLRELITCFTNPIAHAKRVLEIGKVLRAYKK
jgi:hypothetical protein